LIPFLSACLLMAIALADVPNQMSYQGRLTDDAGQPLDGSTLIKFTIYGSESGDDSLWSSGFQVVQVTDGLFEYRLGSNVWLPPSVFMDAGPRFLGTTVDVSPEGQPRLQLISAPYAYRAHFADSASGTGWKVVENSVLLEDEDNHVSIGTAMSDGKLTVRNDGTEVTGVVGHDSAGVYGYVPSGWPGDASGVQGWHYDSEHWGELGSPRGGVVGHAVSGFAVFGENLSGSGGWGGLGKTVSGISVGVEGVRGEDPNSRAGLFVGNVEVLGGHISIGFGPSDLIADEPLVIGKNLGTYAGNRVVIGDDEPGVGESIVGQVVLQLS